MQMTLYEAGKDAMEKEFRNLLARHGRPVPPGSLLDVLAHDHGLCRLLPQLCIVVVLKNETFMYESFNYEQSVCGWHVFITVAFIRRHFSPVEVWSFTRSTHLSMYAFATVDGGAY